MGYEIAGGLGVKMADPDREVFVMVGDGSYLMMSSEIVTAVQEGVSIIVVLSTTAASPPSAACPVAGTGGLRHRVRRPQSTWSQRREPGRERLAGESASRMRTALAEARTTVTCCLVCDPDRVAFARTAWWDVPVAEVSAMAGVEQARAEYEARRRRQRPMLGGGDG